MGKNPTVSKESQFNKILKSSPFLIIVELAWVSAISRIESTWNSDFYLQ